MGVGARFRFTRTANAGGLLELDGIAVLLDGICGGVGPYLPTPPALLEELAGRRVDLAAFTHAHPDHLDPDGTQECLYAWGGPPVLGTRAVREALSPWPVTVGESVSAGGVTVTPIPSRHIGAAYRTLEHSSLLPQFCPYSPVLPGLQIFLNFFYIVLYAFFFFHILKVSVAKLLQKSEMWKDIVIELSYRGFSRISDYS